MTELTNEREHAEFEAWHNSEHNSDLTLDRDQHGNYVGPWTASAWRVWQAARRATPSSECASLTSAATDELRNKMDALAKWNDVACRDSLKAYVETLVREAVEADRRARSNSPEFDGIKTQPASAVQGVKTWQERLPEPRTEFQCSMNCCPRNGVCDDCLPVKVHGDPVAARDAEIAELRARLARQSHDEPLCTMRSAFDAIDFMAEHNGPGRAHWALGKLKRVEFAAPPLSSEPQAGNCIGCEGRPSAENNPCAVCGMASEPQEEKGEK